MNCTLESTEPDPFGNIILYYISPYDDKYMVLIVEDVPMSGVLDSLNCMNNPSNTIFEFTVNYNIDVIHKMDKKYLPLDEHTHSYNDLTDKTHYIDYANGEEIELIPEQTMSFAIKLLDGKLSAYNVLPMDIVVKTDDEITLCIDGETYTEVAKNLITENGEVVCYIGNPHFMSGIENGFPDLDESYSNETLYCLAVNAENMLLRYNVSTHSATGINVKVTAKRPVLHQLDEKFIPDSIVRKEDIESGGSGRNLVVGLIPGNMPGSFVADKTFTEICEAFEQGKTIVLYATAQTGYMQLNQLIPDDKVSFIQFDANDTYIEFIQYVIDAQDNLTTSRKTITIS
jgi:hypothetical protein